MRFFNCAYHKITLRAGKLEVEIREFLQKKNGIYKHSSSDDKAGPIHRNNFNQQLEERATMMFFLSITSFTNIREK